MYGYCGKILRVDLSEKTVSTFIPDEKDLREFIGGAGYAVKLHYDMRTFEVDPLSPENTLVLMTGPLTATKAPSTSSLNSAPAAPLQESGGSPTQEGRWLPT